MIRKLYNVVKPNKKFLQSSFLVIAGGLLVGILNYIFKTTTGRLLGPEDYGVLGFLISLTSIFTVFGSSFTNLMSRLTSEALAKNNISKIDSLYRQIRKFALLVSVVIALAVFLSSSWVSLKFQVPSIYIKIISLMFIFTFSNAIGRGLLQGEKSFTKLVGINLIEAILKNIIFVILFYLGYKISSAVFGLLIAAFFSYIIISIIFRKRKTVVKEKTDFKDYIKYFLTNFLSLGIFSIMGYIDVALSKLYLGSAESGHYVALSDMGKIIYYGLISIVLVMFPLISEAYSKNKKHFHILAQTIAVIAILSLPVLTIYYLYPSLVIKILYGTKYLNVSPYLFRSGVAMFVLTLCNMFVYYFLSVKQSKFIIAIVGALILEILLISINHANVGALINNILISFTALLSALTLFYFYSKKDKIKEIMEDATTNH